MLCCTVLRPLLRPLLDLLPQHAGICRLCYVCATWACEPVPVLCVCYLSDAWCLVH